MSDYDNTNKGILFKNDRKETDRHPDYTGTINIEGVEHYLSAWIKQGKSSKFLSLSIGNVKGQRPESTNIGQADKQSKDDAFYDDDIGF